MAEVQTEAFEGDCILFATADWDEPYWTNKQHTACELAKQGWRVLYVESVGLRAPRVASAKDWRRLWRRLSCGLRSFFLGPPQRQENIWVLAPLLIPATHHWPLVGWLNRRLMHVVLTRFVRYRSFKNPIIWTYHPFMQQAIETIPHGSVLYHCVDDLLAVPGVDVEAFRAAEATLLGSCKVVFATSRNLANRCVRTNPNTHYLPNVVDADHFGKAMQGDGPLPADIVSIPEPRLFYHGVLSDFKIDFCLLLDCATRRPEWHWVLVGEEREGQKSELLNHLVRLPNVHHLG